MKKARVRANRKFTDVKLKREIKPNEIYVVSFERAKEISKHPKNLIEIIDVFDDVYDIEVVVSNSLKDLSKNQLKDICKEKGIKTSGTKKELIERLIETQ